MTKESHRGFWTTAARRSASNSIAQANTTSRCEKLFLVVLVATTIASVAATDYELQQQRIT
jgi:hypothetical protein